MNRPADSLEAIVAEMERISCYGGLTMNVFNKLLMRVRALTPQPPAAVVPGAWRWDHPSLRSFVTLDDGKATGGWKITPLYATPTPAAVPDAVRGLVGKWREMADHTAYMARESQPGTIKYETASIATKVNRQRANELETALSAAPANVVSIDAEKLIADICFYEMPLSGQFEDDRPKLVDVLADALGDGTIGPARELIAEIVDSALAAQQDGQP